jgi:hypothetical protein
VLLGSLAPPFHGPTDGGSGQALLLRLHKGAGISAPFQQEHASKPPLFVSFMIPLFDFESGQNFIYFSPTFPDLEMEAQKQIWS